MSEPAVGRLTGRNLIGRVMTEGSRSASGELRVTALDLGDGGPPRVGLSVGRRAGSAVVRNRIKRRIRAAARACDLGAGVAYMVSAGPGIERMEFCELESRLAKLCESARQKSARRHDLR